MRIEESLQFCELYRGKEEERKDDLLQLFDETFYFYLRAIFAISAAVSHRISASASNPPSILVSPNPQVTTGFLQLLQTEKLHFFWRKLIKKVLILRRDICTVLKVMMHRCNR